MSEQPDSARDAAECAPDAPRVWKSIEELSRAEFRATLREAHPQLAAMELDPLERRDVLRLLGGTLALAGVAACTRQPEEKIYPYARSPEATIPGKPLYFATAMPWASGALGLLVESHMGRPTKVEGNPDHPASLGATDVFAQASVLGLYDPDRSQSVKQRGRISTWDALLASLAPELEAQRAREGVGLRILSTTITSPTLAAQRRELLQRFPRARWHQYEPVNRDEARAGAQLAFDADVVPRPRFDRAKLVLALDCDFLGDGPAGVIAQRQFADARRAREGVSEISRLVAIETSPSITGAKADHRLAVRPSELALVAQGIARALEVEIQTGAQPAQWSAWQGWIDALARDLALHKGSSLVVAGAWAPREVHALAHAMNRALGNVGATVVYTDPIEAEPVDQGASLRELVDAMEAGTVEVLVLLGGNPVYDAPVDLAFGERMAKVPLRVRLAQYEDETSELCHWHVPEAHFLESWSDALAFDGTPSIVQPLIAPLYGGRTAHEIANVLLGKNEVSDHDAVQAHWRERYDGELDFESFWRRALHDGFIADVVLPAKSVSLRRLSLPTRASEANSVLECAFRPDPAAWDGRFANNGWLQECPRPLSKIVWDNAALISPTSARELGLENGDVVECSSAGRTLRAPVWIAPGHADGCVTLPLGYGRAKAGALGSLVGANAFALRTSDAPWAVAQLALRKTGDRHELATTQTHHDMEGRDLVRTRTLDHLAGEEHGEAEHENTSLYPPFRYDGRAWGMVIDLNACVGCNACVVACQAENNIPIVGREQVAKGREMHWLRIDRYYSGSLENPRTLFQPLTCMHCETAPCELVCPVGATTHSAEGLNEMTYNRCVGTRYCSNNCPYKVRRFNFLQFSDTKTESLKLLRNPDVTVRTRGVMEKCTYCVQRINAARIEASKEDRPIRDGEVVTACQGACPSRAIVFGDINDAASAVAKLKGEPHEYGLLTELNTKPRTTYLARVENVLAELERAQPGADSAARPAAHKPGSGG